MKVKDVLGKVKEIEAIDADVAKILIDILDLKDENKVISSEIYGACNSVLHYCYTALSSPVDKIKDMISNKSRSNDDKSVLVYLLVENTVLRKRIQKLEGK